MSENTAAPDWCAQAQWPTVPCQRTCREQAPHHHHNQGGTLWTNPGSPCPAVPEPATAARDTLAAAIREHQLDKPGAGCLCGWTWDADADQATARDQHAAHVAAALAPTLARIEREAREDERERIAAAIEAEFDSWDALGPTQAPHPLNSDAWLVERAYAISAQIARQQPDEDDE